MGDLSRQRARARVQLAIDQAVDHHNLTGEEKAEFFRRLLAEGIKSRAGDSSKQINKFAIQIAPQPMELFADEPHEELGLDPDYIDRLTEELKSQYGESHDLTGCAFLTDDTAAQPQ